MSVFASRLFSLKVWGPNNNYEDSWWWFIPFLNLLMIFMYIFVETEDKFKTWLAAKPRFSFIQKLRNWWWTGKL